MEVINKAFADFETAQPLLEWLKSNDLLKDPNANVGQLAFDFALAYAGPEAVAAFLHAAQLESARRAAASAKPKRQQALTGEAAERSEAEFRERYQVVRNNLTEARALATALYAPGGSSVQFIAAPLTS